MQLTRGETGWRPTAIAAVLLVAGLSACSGAPTATPTTPLPSPSGSPVTAVGDPGQAARGIALEPVWRKRVPRGGRDVTGVAGGIALDAHGNLYLADPVTSKVRVFDPQGRPIRSWGTSGTGPGRFDFQAPTNGGRVLAATVAVGRDGSVYVAVPGTGRIEAFDQSGRYLTQWGGLGTTKGRFTLLAGVMVGPNGDVYTVDDGPSAFAVQRFTPNGRFVRGYGSYANSGLFTPTLADVGPRGDVYLADTGQTGNGGIVHPKIVRFGPNGEVVTRWGTHGSAPGEFEFPFSVAVDRAGDVFVGDALAGQIQEFDAEGHPIAAFDLSKDGLVVPTSIAVNGAGDLFVLDDRFFALYRYRLPR